VWLDALTVKVREDGRVVNVHALIATGVNADGHREILGLDVASAEAGAGWLAFLWDLVARGLSGIQLVISDAHPGLLAAIGSALPGAAWQRCRTHYLRILLTRVPKSAQPHVATQIRTIFDQADAAAVHRPPLPDPPGRRRAGRTKRRMDRRPSLHEPRTAHQKQNPHHLHRTPHHPQQANRDNPNTDRLK
jgi:mutator family transposase